MKKYEWAVLIGVGVVTSIGAWLALDRDAYAAAKSVASNLLQPILPADRAKRRDSAYTGEQTTKTANTFGDGSTSADASANQTTKLPPVRPDIKKLIDEKYSNPQERAAMMQFAQAQQYQLDIGSTREGALTGMRAVDQSLACAYAVFGSGQYSKNYKKILAALLSNKDQFKRYAEVSKNLSGQVFNAPRYDKPCIS